MKRGQEGEIKKKEKESHKASAIPRRNKVVGSEDRHC